MTDPKLRKRTGIVQCMMLLLNILVLMALTASYAAGQISPDRFWPLAFFAMAYPILLLSVIVLSVYWAFADRWWLLLNLAFIVVKWDYVSATFQTHLISAPVPTSGSIKVMTYNVRLFDYFNWTNDPNTQRNLYKFIYGQQPDILCIQEFFFNNRSHFPIMDTLNGANSIKHAHFENYRSKLKKNQSWGMATFSSFPIIHRGRIDFKHSSLNLSSFTDMLIGNDTVRVYNVHLQSIRLGRSDYKVMDNIIDINDWKDVGDYKLLISKMKHAFKKRAVQAEAVARHIQNSPYPVIVCGDFNDVPTSYAYQTIVRGLCDSFGQSGSGTASTYVRIPFFRIDNILFGPEFRAVKYTVHPKVLSDHRAVTSILVHAE